MNALSFLIAIVHAATMNTLGPVFLPCCHDARNNDKCTGTYFLIMLPSCVQQA